jgi:hypothetical protein
VTRGFSLEQNSAVYRKTSGQIRKRGAWLDFARTPADIAAAPIEITAIHEIPVKLAPRCSAQHQRDSAH